MGCVKTV